MTFSKRSRTTVYRMKDRDQFPHSVLALVATQGYLDMKTLCSGANVSREWHSVAYAPSCLGKSLDFTQFPGLTSHQLRQLINEHRIRPCLRRVYLHTCRDVGYTTIRHLTSYCRRPLKEVSYCHRGQDMNLVSEGLAECYQALIESPTVGYRNHKTTTVSVTMKDSLTKTIGPQQLKDIVERFLVHPRAGQVMESRKGDLWQQFRRCFPDYTGPQVPAQTYRAMTMGRGPDNMMNIDGIPEQNNSGNTGAMTISAMSDEPRVPQSRLFCMPIHKDSADTNQKVKGCLLLVNILAEPERVSGLPESEARLMMAFWNYKVE
eukprot:881015_1